MIDNCDRQTHTQRNYGIDMLRIIAMYMVVVIHVLGMGRVYGEECSTVSTIINTFCMLLL